jgi:hypothetical protein
VHGVAGVSKRRKRGRTGSGGGGTRRRGGQATRQQRARGRAGASDGAQGGINRDRLLQTLFPNGVPAQEEVIRRASAWLDEAEKLARTK